MNFPEYSVKRKEGRMEQFLKPFGNSSSMFIGFEYDSVELNRNINKHGPDLPEKFDMFLAEFKPSSKKPDKLALTLIGNPICFPPCRSLSSYSSIEMYYEEGDEAYSEDLKYEPELTQLPDGRWKVSAPKEYDQKLRRHAFFYMKSLSVSSKPFIEYIEKCVLAIIEEK